MRLKGLYPIIDVGFISVGRALDVAKQLLAGGSRLFQLRAKELSSREFLALSLDLAALARKHDATFIVNDRADIALLASAHGVHLGSHDLPLAAARKILGNERLIGVSTHSLAEALAAEAGGADYIAFGPIFSTATKADAQKPKGVGPLSELKVKVKLPLVAIGGITESNLQQVIDAGADAVAIISDLLSAPDIKEKTEKLLALAGQGND